MNCQLNVPIPSSVGNCSGLAKLNLRVNYITGTLPDTIGSLLRLNLLEVQANQIKGTVPSTFRNLQSMSQLYLFDNYLSGSLTNVFDPSVQVNLTQVQVNNNQFTGPLPGILFGTRQLSVFIGSLNCFYGSISLDICRSKYLNESPNLNESNSSRKRSELQDIVDNRYVVFDNPLITPKDKRQSIGGDTNNTAATLNDVIEL